MIGYINLGLDNPLIVHTGLVDLELSVSDLAWCTSHVQIKVLLASEDCPERRLPVWTHYVLQVSEHRQAYACMRYISRGLISAMLCFLDANTATRAREGRPA